MKLQDGTIEARIVKLLKDWYPVTVEELRDELGLPRGTLDRALKSLMLKGIIALEPLTDKTYIRLLRMDIGFVGRSAVQRKAMKTKGASRRAEEDSDSYIYR
jgi:DNA-binding transcriptional ArsR family regulator